MRLSLWRGLHSLPLGIAAACCLLAFGADGAAADNFGPISLASVGSLASGPAQQAEYAHDSVVSGDGRYVAFDGAVGGAGGVWRRDLQSGRLQQVAGGDAELPSISEDGQYVSFTTNQGTSLGQITRGLAGQMAAKGSAVAESAQVYVRNMAVEPAERCAAATPRAEWESCAFLPASAVTIGGRNQALRYAAPQDEALGAMAAGRFALSADGREVAFATTKPSDLLAESSPGEVNNPQTPAGEVAVRYLAAGYTKLVSAQLEPATGRTGALPVEERQEAGGTALVGAVYMGSGAFRPVPADGNWMSGTPGAAISADGSTVAWLGQNIAQQARMLPGEAQRPQYTEPLWRRIEPGSESSIERVTGGSDPGSAACLAAGGSPPGGGELQSSTDPCWGPFEVGSASFPNAGELPGIWAIEGNSGGIGQPVPSLSADGSHVAFLSLALPVGSAGLNNNNARDQSADLYLADMRPGLSRAQALTDVTRIAGESALLAVGAPVTEFAVSPDGRQVAFATWRNEFGVGSMTPVSEPLPEVGESELFDANLQSGTITRVTHGYNGGASEQPHPSKLAGSNEDPYYNRYSAFYIGAQSPSFSADGLTLAFASTADNLVFGDGNYPDEPQNAIPISMPDGGNAYVVHRLPTVQQPAPQVISGPPAPPLPDGAWAIYATARSLPDGSVQLLLNLPAPGEVGAVAYADLPSHLALSRRMTAGARRRKALRRDRSHGALLPQLVARAHLRDASSSGSPVVIHLPLARPARAFASTAGGLSGRAEVSFSSPGHPELRLMLDVRFARLAGRGTARAGRSRRRAFGGRRR